MSYGLRIWDASGALQVEVTDRIPRYEAAYSVPNISAGSTYTVNHPGFNISTHYFSTNAGQDIEIEVSGSSVIFRKWTSEDNSGAFYVFFYRS